jgi:hypothetical protein
MYELQPWTIHFPIVEHDEERYILNFISKTKLFILTLISLLIDFGHEDILFSGSNTM